MPKIECNVVADEIREHYYMETPTVVSDINAWFRGMKKACKDFIAIRDEWTLRAQFPDTKFIVFDLVSPEGVRAAIVIDRTNDDYVSR